MLVDDGQSTYFLMINFEALVRVPQAGSHSNTSPISINYNYAETSRRQGGSDNQITKTRERQNGKK